MDIREKSFTGRVVRHWNRLIRAVVEPPALEVLKNCLDEAPVGLAVLGEWSDC